MNNPSNATINGFAAGHKVMSSTLDATTYVVGNTKDAAVATGHCTLGFFSGMKYAIAERRGTKPRAVKDDAAKQRAREELYRRAHGTTSEERGTAIIILSHEGAK